MAYKVTGLPPAYVELARRDQLRVVGLELAYNPGQKRDRIGRWTSIGGGVSRVRALLSGGKRKSNKGGQGGPPKGGSGQANSRTGRSDYDPVKGPRGPGNSNYPVPNSDGSGMVNTKNPGYIPPSVWKEQQRLDGRNPSKAEIRQQRELWNIQGKIHARRLKKSGAREQTGQVKAKAKNGANAPGSPPKSERERIAAVQKQMAPIHKLERQRADPRYGEDARFTKNLDTKIKAARQAAGLPVRRPRNPVIY